MEESLTEAFDQFVIGNYQACLALCGGARPESEFAREVWDSLSARCHLALNHLDQIKQLPRTHPGLASTAFFAVFKNSSADAQRKVAFDKIVESANTSSDPTACYYACVARAVGGDLIDSINYAKSVAAVSPSEFNALRVQLCLAIARPDLAAKLVAECARDDSAAAKLVTAVLNLCTGLHSEAFSCYSDLIAQFAADSSLILANGRAVANLQRGLFAEALEDLESAISAKPDDADTLVNEICCLTHLGKREEAQRELANLAQLHPKNPLVLQVHALQAAFA